MEIRLLDVPVDGGELRVLQWGTGRRVAVAVHGITASAMSWQAVARQMPPGWTLAAPDLRGRGFSADLPSPYGLERHAADVTAVLRHFGGRPVLAGHSMGAYVALLTRDAHPNLSRRLVLVDGGLPLPVPDGVDPEVALEAAIGPAIARLRQTFPSTEAYLDFWRGHPALRDSWGPAVEAYLAYDLVGEPPHLRSSVSIDAVRDDSADMLAGDDVARRPQALPAGTVFLRAPAGLLAEPGGLYPPELAAAHAVKYPHLEVREVPDVNHYTVLLGHPGAEVVARTLEEVARR